MKIKWILRCGFVKPNSLGVSKINVNTECQLAFQEATRAYIEAGKDKEGKLNNNKY